MKKITNEVVKDLYGFITKKYKTKTKYKPSAWEAKILAYVVDKISILKYKDFMYNYATTLGSTIYLPFEVGSDKQYSLRGQIVVCGHEHTHILHADKMGRALWTARYVFSKGFRTEAEVKAYICSMELNYLLSGTVPNPTIYAAMLLDYKLDEQDAKIALSAFKRAKTMIERGFYQSQLTKDIRDFLK